MGYHLIIFSQQHKGGVAYIRGTFIRFELAAQQQRHRCQRHFLFGNADQAVVRGKQHQLVHWCAGGQLHGNTCAQAAPDDRNLIAVAPGLFGYPFVNGTRIGHQIFLHRRAFGIAISPVIEKHQGQILEALRFIEQPAHVFAAATEINGARCLAACTTQASRHAHPTFQFNAGSHLQTQFSEFVCVVGQHLMVLQRRAENMPGLAEVQVSPVRSKTHGGRQRHAGHQTRLGVAHYFLLNILHGCTSLQNGYWSHYTVY